MPVFEALMSDSSALAPSIIYVYVVLQLDMFFFFLSEKVFRSRMSYLIYVVFFFFPLGKRDTFAVHACVIADVSSKLCVVLF